MPVAPDNLPRLRLRIAGQVQGVGFRPTVYRLATSLHLTGHIRNDPAGVTLEIQGPRAALDTFLARLPAELPPLARIDSLTHEQIPPMLGELAFQIIVSELRTQNSELGSVTIDTAVCPNCLREILDPHNRRAGYGLTNCTNCGPRFSIIKRIPYDRPNTTMADFPLCEQCQKEYLDPQDRRFHAQPVCCPKCGPAVVLVAGGGTRAKLQKSRLGASTDVRKRGVNSQNLGAFSTFFDAAKLLEEGKVLAIKGLGGFHLACRADSAAAVGELRQRKSRDAKPLAIMCRDLAAVRLLVELSDAGERELTSCRAPIVLAASRHNPLIPQALAPGNHRIGVILPYTPVHHLLFAALDPSIPALVMTSGNVSDEPIAYEDSEALVRLGLMCEAFLTHGRPIQRPVEDSVVLDTALGLLPMRRSRGYAPVPISLLDNGLQSHGLCVGAELKNVVGVVRGSEMIASQHLGDLTNSLAYKHFQQAIADLIELFGVSPQWIAHDLHPSYLSTQHALTLAKQWGVPLLGVQHHHAHAAGVLAEHDLSAGVAVVCDGTGYGPDGTIWGGEVLQVLANGTFTRLARLKPIRLAGGDAAAKDTRRPALALLQLAYGQDFTTHPVAERLVPEVSERKMLQTMIRKGVNSPWTSSTGRVFDGMAALLGVCDQNLFEAQSGQALEAISYGRKPAETGPLWELEEGEVLEINVAKLVRHIVAQVLSGQEVADLAALFHQQLAEAFAGAVAKAAGDAKQVGISGGVAANQVFVGALGAALGRVGLEPLLHRIFPPNDGGIAFGQSVVARQRLMKKS